MKVVSLMPAVTQMIYDLGLEQYLYGVTFECGNKALLEKQIVVKCKVPVADLTSEEINTIYSQSKATGESLYYIDEEVLSAIAPDVVFTQDVCDVCQIDTQCASVSIEKLEKQPAVISITPNSLEDVIENLLTIATAMGFAELGEMYVQKLRVRINKVEEVLRLHKARPKNVLLLEWIQPIFNCGHWIPHQIEYAGGVDVLSNPSGDSVVIDFQKIVNYNPEIIVLAPCGYDINRTKEDLKFLEANSEWNNLKAVMQQQVYIVDYIYFTQSSLGTLVAGIEILAQIFHPSVFDSKEVAEKIDKVYS